MGIVTADMLAARQYPPSLWECGGVELRADGLNPDLVAGAVSDFDNEKGRRGFTGPVIFTLRLRRDGGAWPDDAAAERNAIWESLPPGTCDWVDLEVDAITQVDEVTLDTLRSSGVKVLLSHHAFTPEDSSLWETRLDTMRAFHPDGVKFAVTASTAQIPLLLEFARKVGAEFSDACVLGMGAEGSVTRLVSPLLGCALTYGFIGDGAVAPGQLPVKAMQDFFARAARADSGVPAADAPVAHWLEWAAARMEGP